MRSPYKSGGFAAVALSLVLAGCGGGGGGGGDDPPPPPPNQVPVARAGADQSVFKAAAITLDGSTSSDADNHPLSYRWTQTGGTAVTLSSTTASRPTFTAPSTSGALTFSLIVNDGRVDSPADTVQVAITNRAPVANAGVDGTTSGGTLYTLDALASTDPDADVLNYTWVQLSGPAVTLTTVGLGRVRFTAPMLNGRLDFAVTANDGETNSTQDSVSVMVTSNTTNQPPSLYVDPGYTAAKRASVSMSSYGWDPEGFALSYQWTQVSGPTVTLAGATTPYATFTAPATAGTLEFEVVANDGVFNSNTERVTIVVQNFAPTVMGVDLTPTAPRTLDNLVVVAVAEDPDQDPVTVTYAWTRNGVAQPSVTGSTYPASLTTRDDVIVATVTASDGTDSTSVDATVTIEDTPPTLTATNPPTDVNYGDMVTFQVVAGSDPDGDPVGSYLVKLGPAGFAVSNAGTVTWLASGPMFDTAEEIAWSIGISSAPTGNVGGTIRMNHASRQVPLLRTGNAVPQHRDELVVTDLDANGIDEILVTDGRTLTTMTKVGANYEQNWAYPFNLNGVNNGIFAIAAADVTGNSQKEIFVATELGITQISGSTRKPIAQFTDTQQTHCLSLRVVDLEGNGPKEVIFLGKDPASGGSGSVIVILNAADLTLKARISQTGLGGELDVGNVDADAALEIVTSNGYVYDGATRNNEWAYGPQFGQTVAIGDLDGDNVGEIVALVGWNVIRVYSAVSKSPLREIPNLNTGGIAELRVQDISGDARAEVITGDAQWGSINAYSYNTGPQNFTTLWTISSQDHGTSALAIGNTDGDAALEFVWGTGVSHSGEDILIVAESPSLNAIDVEWSSETGGSFDGPFLGGQLARTAPGVRQLMFASPRTQSGYGGARLMAMNPTTGATVASGELGTNWAYAQGIDVADVDNDGIDEIFLASANLYDPFFTLYDFASGTSEWTSPAGYASASSVMHADFSGDGRADFLTMGSDGRVTIFNPAQSNVIWQSTQLNGGGTKASAADLDADGRLDVIALTGSYLYVYGRSSNTDPFLERGNIPLAGANNLLVADTDGNGEHEIFVFIPSGSYTPETTMQVYDRQLQLQRTVAIPARVTNVVVEPSSSSRKNLLISTGGDSYSYYAPGAAEIWAIDAVTGTGVWRSPGFPGMFSRDSLNAVDVNSDGQYELSFGTNVGAFVTR